VGDSESFLPLSFRAGRWSAESAGTEWSLRLAREEPFRRDQAACCSSGSTTIAWPIILASGRPW